jgi:hypothetical protein
MCKEMLAIPVNRLVDPKRKIGKMEGQGEEERHKGLLTPPPHKNASCICKP